MLQWRVGRSVAPNVLKKIKFTIRSINDPFKWNFDWWDVTDVLERWRLRLYEFNIVVINNSRTENRAAGELSRLGTEVEGFTGIHYHVPVELIDLYEDRSEATHIWTNTICHVCDHRERKRGTVMRKENARAEQDGTNCDIPQTLTEFIYARAQILTWLQYAVSARHPDARLYIESSGILKIQNTIDCPTVGVVPISLEAHFLYLTFYWAPGNVPENPGCTTNWN